MVHVLPMIAMVSILLTYFAGVASMDHQAVNTVMARMKQLIIM